MLPHAIIHTGQIERAKQIIESLKNEEVDVIVFQEAFDHKAREIIRKGLKKYFPYETGNPAKNVFYKITSGVWVISKVPIQVVKRIYFNNGKGMDKFACKGAVLLEGKKNNFCFQIAATHLQSDLIKSDVRRIRKEQYLKISKELLEPYAQTKVPQFVVGDMNTSGEDSLSFMQMLGILKVKQCVFESKLNFSYDCSKNDIIKDENAAPQLLDHIFFNKKETAVEGKMFVKIFRRQWDAFHSDLSDHFAIMGTFSLN
jgi:endonuclease/exonuclease/phosphatase family metal-dependent hydrolase